jgi:hypothetical protein
MSRAGAGAGVESAPVTITVSLQVVNGALTETLNYSNGSGTAAARKQKLQQQIIAEKKDRGKTFVVPHPDHSQDLKHHSWITNPGDTVEWTCSEPFALFVDYDLAPCDPRADTPRNPFGWTGVQIGEQAAGVGLYKVTGKTRYDRSLDQLFYKFEAWVAGANPLDPDGLCGSGT